jgi:photosystem II stability/assembly factor-like uncharacterized protein
MSAPLFPMTSVYAVGIDTRRDPVRLLAAVESAHFGPTVATSDDLGATWHEPDLRPIAFPDDADTALVRVWQIAPGGAREPDVVYAGTEPQALFRSTDGGVTYELVRGLWDHPHRGEWGAGYGGPAIHTIIPHADDPTRVLVAMSTGGVYRTADSGTTWEASNRGIRASFLPDNEYPEFGQCVHKVASQGSRPEQLFVQNHNGVYRSDDGGAEWASIADGLPTDFGFTIVTHSHRPGVVYTFPIEAGAMRFPPQARCLVYRSEDAGGAWQALGDGLPDEPFYVTVLRDAMCVDNAETPGVYFGTRGGEIFASGDEGDHWQQVASHLPAVLCLRAAML